MKLIKVFSKLEPMRIAIEASSKAFWVADVLEKCGHVPVVTDPGRTKAIGGAKIKHDELDAKVLAMLCVADLLVEVNRPTLAQRVARMPVVARDGLVRSRTMLVNQVRSMLDSEGIITKPCATEVFVDHVVDLWDDLPPEMGAAIEPVLNAIHALTEEIKACDKKIGRAIGQDEEAKRIGRKKAVVAVARKLASVLWSMLRNQKPFEPRLAETA